MTNLIGLSHEQNLLLCLLKNDVILLRQIHFQDLLVALLVALMNHKQVAGFINSQLLHTSHTLMLILQMFWIDLRSHSIHLGEHLQRKQLPTQICEFSPSGSFVFKDSELSIE